LRSLLIVATPYMYMISLSLRCRGLQGVAGCCRVLQCVAVCCSVLQCVAVCCWNTPRSNVLPSILHLYVWNKYKRTCKNTHTHMCHAHTCAHTTYIHAHIYYSLATVLAPVWKGYIRAYKKRWTNLYVYI